MAVRPPLTHKPTPPAPAPSSEPVQQAAPAPVAQEQAQTQRGRGGGSGYRSPSRIGKRAAVAWLEPEAVKQLNIYATVHDRQVQDILVEAINMWFAANNLPRFD